MSSADLFSTPNGRFVASTRDKPAIFLHKQHRPLERLPAQHHLYICARNLQTRYPRTAHVQIWPPDQTGEAAPIGILKNPTKLAGSQVVSLLGVFRLRKLLLNKSTLPQEPAISPHEHLAPQQSATPRAKHLIPYRTICGLVLFVLAGKALYQGFSSRTFPAFSHATSQSLHPFPPTSEKQVTWHDETLKIARFVEETSGKQFTDPVPTYFLSAEEFAAILATENTALPLSLQETRIENTPALLRALGLAQGPIDLEKAWAEFYEENLLGFYDNHEKSVFLKKSASPREKQILLAHELTHALQDQLFDLSLLRQRAIMGSLKEKRDPTKALFALTSLLEGEALQVEEAYARTFSEKKNLEEVPQLVLPHPHNTVLPPVLTLQQTFPYEFGPLFIEYLAATGGRAAIDAAFADLPSSEEHILFPETFLRKEKPVFLPLPSLPDKAVSFGSEQELGALFLFLILSEKTAPDVAKRAIEGWGGDRSLFFMQDKRSCIRFSVTGDTPTDTQELFSAFTLWAQAMPSAGNARVENSTEVVIVTTCDPGEIPTDDTVGANIQAYFSLVAETRAATIPHIRTDLSTPSTHG